MQLSELPALLRRRFTLPDWRKSRTGRFLYLVVVWGALCVGVGGAAVLMVTRLLAIPSFLAVPLIDPFVEFLRLLPITTLGGTAFGALWWLLLEHPRARAKVPPGAAPRRRRLARALAAVPLVVAGAALGVLGGIHFHRSRMAEAERHLARTASLMYFETYANLAYRSGNAGAGRRALEGYLERLSDLEAAGLPSWSSLPARGLAHARLGLLEERAGRPAEARRHLAAAAELLAEAGWRDTSEQAIRAHVARIDELAE